MNVVVEQVCKYVSFDVLVMICGELGIGKVEIVCVIYYMLLCFDQVFYEFNCVGLFDVMFQVKLFGVKWGIFFGVLINKVGFFQKVDCGMLFFNGIEILSDQM